MSIPMAFWLICGVYVIVKYFKCENNNDTLFDKFSIVISALMLGPIHILIEMIYEENY